jgi:multidrug efflux system outer membrane protein
MRPLLFILPASLVLTGCVMGPDYRQPGASTGSGWREGRIAPTELPDEWWRVFRDSALNEHIAQALAANQNIAAAKARVDTARALVGAARAGWWPQASAGASLTKAHASAGTVQASPAFSPDLTTTSLRAAMDLSYEADLWGRIRREEEAARASLNGSADRLAAQRLTIAAEVARTYFLWRSLGTQAEILDETVNWRRDSLEMQASREKAGLITAVDSARAKSELDLARADLENIKRQRGSAEHALAALCGLPPSQFRARSGGALRVPEIGPGIPSTLLRRRPDIRAAEQDLIAANAKIGSAQAEALPSFKLLGSAGLQSLDASSILNWENRILSIGPSLTAPLLTGGRVRANVEAAAGRRDEAAAVWRQSIITALREVEDALLDLKGLAAQDQALASAESAAADADRLARDRYAGKIAAYYEVVDANRTLLAIRLTRAQIAGQRSTAAAALARALGGGWSAGK